LTFCAAFAFSSSALRAQAFTAGTGASIKGLVIRDLSTFFPLPFSERFSDDSEAFSTDVEAWDLFSQFEADSDGAFCIESASSSLAMVVVEDAPESGRSLLDGAAVSWTVVCFEVAAAWLLPWVSVRETSASASSAQLGTEPMGALEAAVEGVVAASFDGVVAPEDCLVEAGAGVDSPLAACAYENVMV
jgi:hypothetical protein